MVRRIVLVLAAVGAVLIAEAKVSKTSFERVPKAALTALKATVGRPFTAGIVFVNGHYLEPPYTVERWGTALRINGTQVTGQVIAWDEFLKTQEGARIERTEPASAPAAAEAAEEDVVEEEDAADDDCSLDDLFEGSSSKPKVRKPARRKAAKPVAAEAPSPTVTVTFEGEFKANARTKEMVATINRQRTKIEATLRSGGYCFFGSRHRMVLGEARVAGLLLDGLPSLMKEYSDNAAFQTAVARHFSFLPIAVRRDLFEHRLDYPKLQERAKNMKGERQWGALLSQ